MRRFEAGRDYLLVKCTFAIRQLAYAAVPDSLDEYFTNLHSIHFTQNGCGLTCPQAFAQFKNGVIPGVKAIHLLEAVPSQTYGNLAMPSCLRCWQNGAVLYASYSQPRSNDVKRIRYKQAHEATRKDVE
ncbi:hypothetical protein Tco_0562107 [Tanacetum coccineum]